MKNLPIEVWEATWGAGRQLIDVREADEFAAGHLPGAQNFPLSCLPDMLPQLDKHRPCYVVCQKGMRSARAGHWLHDQGYEVIALTGGLDALVGRFTSV